MAASAASEGGAVEGGGGLLQGFKVSFDSKFGSVLSDMKKFQNSWDGLQKNMKPVTDMWNRFNGVFQKTLGAFKTIIAPLAIAGGLFAAFLLTGEAGRAVFGIFGNIIGAFADILTASLMPAITPIIKALVAMLPKWQAIFGSEEWKNAMTRLGEALGTLVTAGMDVFLIVIKAVVDILPVFVGFLSDMALVLATALTYLRDHPAFLKAIAEGITLVVGAIISLGAAGIIAIFAGVALAIGAIGAGLKFLVDHWTDIQAFFGTLKDSIPIISKLADGLERAVKAAERLAQLGHGVFGGGPIGQATGLPIPFFQSGGVMPYTGLAVVHAGETIIPAGGGGGGGGNVYLGPVYVTGTDQHSAEEFARKISEILRREWLGNINTIR